MKKKDWIVLISLAAFDYLFYKQQAGINFSVFTVLLISGSMFYQPGLKYNPKWLLVSVAAIFTSLSVGYYGDDLSVIANVVSLAILSSFLAGWDSSVCVAIAGAVLAYIRSPFDLIMVFVQRFNRRQAPMGQEGRLKIGFTLLAIAIALVFFFIYRGSSLMFYSFTQKINLNFISFFWIVFTLNGLLVLSAFFNFRHVTFLHKILDVPAKKIELAGGDPLAEPGIATKLKLENYTGMLLLLLLNVLLLTVNLLDVGYFVGGELPQGVTYTQYVHQGVGMLILSITLSISIILFFFKGKLNFYNENKWLRILAYAWMVQNVLMVVSTIFRNNMYIDAFGLTEKRIGVYIYLTLTLVGLVTTLLKIRNVYSNAYLLRLNSWIFYAILVGTSMVDWGKMITRHDLKQKDAAYNFGYLTGLSDSSLPLLLKFSQDSANLPEIRGSLSRLHNKVLRLLEEEATYQGWQSWCYKRDEVFQGIMRSGLKEMEIVGLPVRDIPVLARLNKLEELSIQHCKIQRPEDFGKLNHLKKLVAANNHLSTIFFVTYLKNLEYLDISQNQIVDYAPLYLLPNLKVLVLDKPNDNTLNGLRLMLPHTTIIER